MKKMTLILLPIVVVFLSGCTNKQWTGFYYPAGTGAKTVYSAINQFDTYEECFNWVDEQSDVYSNPESEDWECGSNCRLSSDSKTLMNSNKKEYRDHDPTYLCDETR